ncbi:OB-fold domain-containing protein [Variovorax sp. J22P240]|uniref:Zn-ribbon domain-containing OB-fold protein n=1 Tax=unclassified Variovorax TaxID=663243 RepID=UPI002578F88F|nr:MULTISPECIES: OB-fold domain-containing protein [unclassified Variovorax]MDM0002569.1 OB-fold domain-containing protein [Variovorax sp. J22P240]MDM0053576.1 OB-fold domain-containing protein [Variovorax sp. J22R115]
MTETLNYSKPLPSLEASNKPFWDAARSGKLALQHCADCEKVRYPINHVCPHCLSDRFEWKAVSGRGTVYSSIVFHQVYNQAFAGDVPYNVSLIQLEEGPRMISNVVGLPPSEVKVGDRVQVVFDPVTPEISIPRFQRAG